MYSRIDTINFLIFNFVLIGVPIYLIVCIFKGWTFFRQTLPTAVVIFGIMTLYWLGSVQYFDTYDSYPWSYSLLGIGILTLTIVVMRLRPINRSVRYLLIGLGVVSLLFGPIALGLHIQTEKQKSATASTNKVGSGGFLPMLGSSSCGDQVLF